MAIKDYQHKENPRRSRHTRRGNSGGFFWFVTGAVVGAFGVGLAWTLHDQPPPPAAASPQAQAEPAKKPRFIFHKLLPEMEVQVPDEELGNVTSLPAQAAPKPRPKKEPPKPAATRPATAKTAKAEQPKKPAADSASYLIQVASLRKASDAEQLKARLALLGIRADIRQVTVNGKDYHRVRTGPYQDKQEINKIRALLSSNGMEAITIKLK